MPDDVTTVTEQKTEPVPDNPADEALGFKTDKADRAEDAHGDFAEGFEPEKVEKPVKVKSEKIEAPSEDKAEEETEPEETSEEDEETDEDLKRGKEILDAEEKAKADEQARKDAQRPPAPIQPKYNPFVEKNDEKTVRHFKSVIPTGLLPDTATLEDGSVLDFKGIFETEPEIPVMAVAIANNVVEQLVANNYLATQSVIREIEQSFENKLFIMRVTNAYDGVPDAVKIANDPKFQKWQAEQPKAVQALFNSTDPLDHIRGFKRFLGASGLKAATDKVVSLDKKKAEAKANFDAVYKTTIRSKGKPKGSALSPKEEEAEGFASKDGDDDLY